MSDPQEIKAESAPGHTGSMYFKMPEFIPEDPEFWLAQLESQFSNMSIRSESRKFSYLVAALPRTLAPDVRDIVLRPPEINPYTTLKEALLQRTAMSEERRIRNLLDGVQMDDRSPTQLLRHMRQLAGQNVISDSVLRQLWLKRLPEKVQSVVSIFSTKCTLDELAEGADRAMENTSTIAPITATSSQSEIESLRADINNLRAEIKYMRQGRRRSSSRGQRRPVSRDKSKERPPGICWYHYRFGDQARKCQKPCRYQGQQVEKNH